MEKTTEKYNQAERLEDVCRTALSLLKNGGASNACCGASFTEVREFNADSGRFSLYRTLYGRGLSLTALSGGKRGSVSANSFEKEDVEKLCADCLAAAQAGKPDEAYTIAAEGKRVSFVSGAPDCDEEKLFERSRELLETVKTRYPLIMVEQMIVTHMKTETLYADFSGTRYGATKGEYSVELMYSAHEGKKTSSFFGSGAVFCSLDRPFIELGRIADELDEVQRQIETKPVDGKFVGTVIFPPSAFEELLAAAVANFASGGALLEGTSPWKDSVGRQVAAESLTLSLSPADSRIVCGSTVSAEGFLNRGFTLIENGVLKSFVLSHYFAKKLSMQASPNTTDSYVVKGGEAPLADIVKSVKKGLWVNRLSGGAPASNGDFSAVAKNSFLIEDGEIKEAVSETMINGNLKDMLMSISALSRETVEDGATVLPFAAVDGIIISGK